MQRLKSCFIASVENFTSFFTSDAAIGEWKKVLHAVQQCDAQ